MCIYIYIKGNWWSKVVAEAVAVDVVQHNLIPCVHMCVRACVRACVNACVRASVRACAVAEAVIADLMQDNLRV